MVMKIQVGTKVRFLNDIGGGVVKGFRNNEIVLVETDDGFELPVRVSDLIVEEPFAYGFEGEDKISLPVENISEEAEKVVQVNFEEKKYAAHKGEVLLALVPENDQLLHVSNLGLYLINDSNYYFHYVISYRDNGVFSLVSPGTIEPDSKLELKNFSQSSIAKVKEFRLQGVFFKHGLHDLLKPIDLQFSIGNISFYKIQHFRVNEYFHQKALILKEENKYDLKEAISKLDDDVLAKVITIKEEKKQNILAKPEGNKDLVEVDLHIEEIVDNHSELSNGEIIKIQLSRFETGLETAIRSKTKKIVFIHGVGNGRLKHEMLKKLDRNYPDLQYQDASFKEYGFGATMVYLM